MELINSLFLDVLFLSKLLFFLLFKFDFFLGNIYLFFIYQMYFNWSKWFCLFHGNNFYDIIFKLTYVEVFVFVSPNNFWDRKWSSTNLCNICYMWNMSNHIMQQTNGIVPVAYLSDILCHYKVFIFIPFLVHLSQIIIHSFLSWDAWLVRTFFLHGLTQRFTMYYLILTSFSVSGVMVWCWNVKIFK